MPAKEAPPLTNEERGLRSRGLADESSISDDPTAFDGAFEKIVNSDRNGARTGMAEKPKIIN